MAKALETKLRVKHYFEKQGWKQLELAALTGIAQPSIHKILTGKTGSVDFKTLTKLAEAFRVHPGDLFTWNGEPEKPGKKY